MLAPVSFGDSRLPARFWRRCEAITETGCWIWLGTVTRKGRPHFSDRHVTVQAHRYAYLKTVGKIPQGLQLDHKCAVPLCVNPNHLEPVTQSINERRKGGSMFTGWEKPATDFGPCIHGHPSNRRSPKGVCRECGVLRTRKSKLKKQRADTATAL